MRRCAWHAKRARQPSRRQRSAPDKPLAQSADKVFQTTVPPLPDELAGMIVPGVRSYLASQIGLYSAAIRIR
ncbi:MAG: hypothetical protein U0528_19660 [Anaerolineae bacterium]